MRAPVEIPEAVDRWRMETARLYLVSPSRARAAARRATAAARRLPAGRPRAAGRAVAAEARAVAEHAAGSYARAASLYALAAKLYETLGLVREGARVRKNRVDALQYLHRIPEALSEGSRAVRAFERLGDRAGLARALMNLAILEQRRDEPARALALYARSRRLFAALDDAPNLALAALNEAVTRTSVDDFRKALDLFEIARAQYARADLPLPVAQADFDESWVHVLLGDFRRALGLLERARAVFARARDALKVAVLDLDRTETLLLLNRPAEAASAIAGALRLFRRERMPLETGRALVLAAEAHAELGDIRRAVRELGDAIARLEDAGNRGGAARARLAMARLELARARPERAAALAARASKRLAALRLPSAAAAADLVAADALLALGRPGAASERLRRLAPRGARLPAETAVHLHHLRGRAFAALGRTAPAYRALLRSIAGIERVRGSVPGLMLRAGWLGDKVRIYEDALALCLDKGAGGGVRAAFHHAEQGRARTLSDRLTSGLLAPDRARARDARKAEGKSALIERYQTIREEARWLAGRLAREGAADPGRPGAEARRLRALARREQALASLLPRLQSADQNSASLVAARGATAEEIQREIPSGTTLVEYFVRERETIVFVLDRREVRAIRLTAGAADLDDALDELRFEWDRFLLGAGYSTRHAGVAEQGARRVLGRIHAMIARPIEEIGLARRLVVVPSGPLHDIPFSALLGERGYLVDRHEIAVAASASAWRAARRRARLRGRGRARRGGGTSALIMGAGAGELPGAPAECAAVAATLSRSVVRLGREATLDAFRHMAPAAGLIHLAAHGTFRSDDPLLSSIQLADAPLNLHELYDLDLHARLVVLSGCQTAASRLDAGEEMLGLAQGFMVAGARDLVVSLWSVDDPSTALLMGRFYRLLRTGRPPSAALRDAMIAHREQYPHPYYWAPFRLIGAALEREHAPAD